MFKHILFQIICLVFFQVVYNNIKMSVFKDALGVTLDIAKVSAYMITINFFILSLTIIKFPLKFYYNKLSKLHVSFAVSLYIWSIIHCVFHYINYFRLRIVCKCFKWGPGLTGFVGLIILAAILIFRKKNKYITYETFHMIHLISFFSFYIFISIHGTFCLLRLDNNECIQPLFWIVTIVPLLITVCENIYKYKNKYQVTKVDFLYDKTVRISIGYKSGLGKIYICNPKLSILQFHPFITVNTQNDQTELYIKNSGDWTRQFIDSIKVGDFLFVDGVYKIEELKDDCVILAFGIGMTTFASQLNNPKIKKAIWVVKNIECIEWMHPLPNKVTVYVTRGKNGVKPDIFNLYPHSCKVLFSGPEILKKKLKDGSVNIIN